MNKIILGAVKKLEANTRPEYSAKTNTRGNFPTRFFMVSRSQKSVSTRARRFGIELTVFGQTPENNKYMTDNLEHAIQFSEDVRPVLEYTEGKLRQFLKSRLGGSG